MECFFARHAGFPSDYASTSPKAAFLLLTLNPKPLNTIAHPRPVKLAISLHKHWSEVLRRNLQSRKLTWKPQKGSIKTTVPQTGGHMGFHVSLGECTEPHIQYSKHLAKRMEQQSTRSPHTNMESPTSNRLSDVFFWNLSVGGGGGEGECLGFRV